MTTLVDSSFGSDLEIGGSTPTTLTFDMPATRPAGSIAVLAFVVAQNIPDSSGLLPVNRCASTFSPNVCPPTAPDGWNDAHPNDRVSVDSNIDDATGDSYDWEPFVYYRVLDGAEGATVDVGVDLTPVGLFRHDWAWAWGIAIFSPPPGFTYRDGSDFDFGAVSPGLGTWWENVLPMGPYSHSGAPFLASDGKSWRVGPAAGYAPHPAAPTDATDTTLSVWTGADLASLVEVASSDDTDFNPPGNFTSAVEFSPTAGVTYWVQVGLYDDTTTGPIVLEWGRDGSGATADPPGAPSTPANDDFADAEVITGFDGQTEALTLDGATTEAGEPAGSNLTNGAHHTVWFKWVCPASPPATIIFDTAPSYVITGPAPVPQRFAVAISGIAQRRSVVDSVTAAAAGWSDIGTALSDSSSVLKTICGLHMQWADGVVDESPTAEATGDSDFDSHGVWELGTTVLYHFGGGRAGWGILL